MSTNAELIVTDEAVEAAARAMALVDNDDGCFERLDLWNATAPEDRWQIEEPQSYDEEATHWWRKRARAALAAAPVSLEAVKAETTTEWACVASGIVRPLGSRPAAFEHAQLCGGSIQAREVTEWRPVETEGETK